MWIVSAMGRSYAARDVRPCDLGGRRAADLGERQRELFPQQLEHVTHSPLAADREAPEERPSDQPGEQGASGDRLVSCLS